MESSIHWLPGRERREWVFLEPLSMLCGAGTWLWASREWHVLIQENSSSEQDSHEHWETGCVKMTSCDICLAVTFLPCLCCPHSVSVPAASLLLGMCLEAVPPSVRQEFQLWAGADGLPRNSSPRAEQRWAAFLGNAQVSPGGACLAAQSQVMTPGWCLFGLISLPWKQVASAWQCGYTAPRCQTESDYVSLEAQRSLSRAVLGVCPAVHSRHLLLGMEASLNRLIFARWREGNHPNQLHSVWLDLCKGVTVRMTNLASLWKLSNGEVHVCLVAQFIEANTWKIPSPFPLFSLQFTGRTLQV